MTTTTTLCGTCIHRTVCKFAVKQQPTFCSQHYLGNCSESITYTERDNTQTIYPKQWSYWPKESVHEGYGVQEENLS